MFLVTSQLAYMCQCREKRQFISDDLSTCLGCNATLLSNSLFRTLDVHFTVLFERRIYALEAVISLVLLYPSDNDISKMHVLDPVDAHVSEGLVVFVVLLLTSFFLASHQVATCKSHACKGLTIQVSSIR